MEISLLKNLLEGISNFELVSSSNSVRFKLVPKYCRKIDEILDCLKPMFDESVHKIPPNEELNKVMEELDACIREAQELVGNWHQMTSKVFFVLQIESVIAKIHAYSLKICKLVDSLLLSPAANCTSTCIERLQHIHYDQMSVIIKEAMTELIEKITPRSESLAKISTSLSLSTNQELLMEAVALEKLKTKTGHGENHLELEHVDQILALINHMHECLVKEKQLHSIKGVPIPTDFCCPLSLELMSDPVIVASGQTYERAFIKKWLEQGFSICPKTRQTLGHTNLIPNYTVKALIANWCESNDIKLPDPMKSVILNLPSAFLSPSDSGLDSVPHSGHSPRANHPRSPESNQLIMNSHKNLYSSNGGNQNSFLHENPMSPSHLLHSQTVNGCEDNVTALPVGNSEAKNETRLSSLEDMIVGSGGETSNQSEDNFQASNVDVQSQGNNCNSSASGAVLAGDHLQGSSEANSVSRVSSDLTHDSSDASGEVTQEAPVSTSPQREPEFLSRLAVARSRSQSIWRRPSDRYPRIVSSPSTDSRPDLSGVETQVHKLIDDLKSDSIDVQREATLELRLLAKHNMENRIVIAKCGAISLLVGLLYSPDQKIQENSVTALLNLSINDNNKAAIANADAIDPLIHVLETGNPEAKENSAATLFSLSVIDENKSRIGRSGAIRPLIELLGNGTPRGKKDAATALYNLSIFHENKIRIVQAGAVRHLVELMDPAAGMVDKAVAVLSNLATIPEGRDAIGRAGGIPVLVEVVELGSARGKENAAAALLHLCTNSNRFCSLVLQEGAVPPLVALSQSGTARAKEKAQALLSYFRNQRHGNAGRG
ncbi:U-box domain-containing protein 4 [Typha latifolia]|uniref:U-box domain-containing protein 4 n=1 Tax=Typha latifolia TaxID=4733 RepID=UPI003C2DBD4D